MSRRKHISVIVLLIACYASTGLYRIAPDEQGVVIRFGAIVTLSQPGLWISYPWGIDRIERIKVQSVRQIEIGYDTNSGDDTKSTPEGQLLSGDQNLVNIRIVVEYSVREDTESIHRYITNKEMVGYTLIREAETSAREWVAGKGIDEVLLMARSGIPTWVMSQLSTRLQTHRLGIKILRVSVGHVGAPAEVREAFEAVTQAQTSMQTRENQARQLAESRQKDADALRTRLAHEATSYREAEIGTATADAESFRKRTEQLHRAKATRGEILRTIWWDEIGNLLLTLKSRGLVEVLDPYLGPSGLDITQLMTGRK